MKTYTIDSFTNTIFKGNPAGVCFPEKKLEQALMLKIAQELNLSETAFVQSLDAENTFSIRYFSPKMEIPLCGHATLAAAKVIFENARTETITFTTMEGLELRISKEEDWIQMGFPVYKTEPARVSAKTLSALGLETVENVVFNPETNILMLEIQSTEVLRNLQPDFPALIASHNSINGVLITAPSHEDQYDFHSRYFWPWSGTNEDPVTGGSHTFMAPYWAAKLGKEKLKSFQSSTRTGFMNLEVIGDQLLIRGQAVIVLEGEMKI